MSRQRSSASSWSRRQGKVAVLVALSLTGMIGVVAIGLDGGLLLDDQQQLQATADAAALAAASDLYQNYPTNNGSDPSGTASKSAQTTAAANGYSNGVNGSTVTVHIPPTSGPFNGQAGYAEVIIQFNQNRYFSNIFGSGAIPVQARAVARGQQIAYSNGGILLLDPNGQGALNDQGNGLTATGAPILVNSNNAQAVVLTGNAAVSAPQIKIAGNSSSSGNATMQGTVTTGVSPTPDPLAKLPVPVPSTLTTQSTSALSYSGGSYTLQPGVYDGGITLSSTASVTLQPGVYYLNGGGLNISGQASISGNGVMIYNNPLSSTDAINISGTGTISLSAPTSGPYMGLTLFQNRSSSVALSLSGGGNISMSGTFYAAGARLNITGNGNTTVGSQYITADLTTTGNGTISVPWSNAKVARVREIRLVE